MVEGFLEEVTLVTSLIVVMLAIEDWLGICLTSLQKARI